MRINDNTTRRRDFAFGLRRRHCVAQPGRDDRFLALPPRDLLHHRVRELHLPRYRHQRRRGPFSPARRRSSTSPFLTEPPETLYVFEYEGKKLIVRRPGVSRSCKAQHPDDGGRSRDASPIPPAASGPASSAPRCSSIGSMALALVHRHQQRDLSERIQPRTAASSASSGSRFSISPACPRLFSAFSVSGCS